MPTIMLNVVEVDDVEEVECYELECELHALTRTTTHKGGRFGLTPLVTCLNWAFRMVL